MTPPPDPAASARARLAQLAREQNAELHLLLSEFAVERLLYRLGRSPYGDRYVLKGAMLFRLWSPTCGRATWDLDLLGHGADGVEDVAAVLREVCSMTVEDGIEFDPKSVRAEEIRPPGEVRRRARAARRAARRRPDPHAGGRGVRRRRHSSGRAGDLSDAPGASGA